MIRFFSACLPLCLYFHPEDIQTELCVLQRALRGFVFVPGRRDVGACPSWAVDITLKPSVCFVPGVFMLVLENHLMLEGCHLQLPAEPLRNVPVPSWDFLSHLHTKARANMQSQQWITDLFTRTGGLWAWHGSRSGNVFVSVFWMLCFSQADALKAQITSYIFVSMRWQ